MYMCREYVCRLVLLYDRVLDKIDNNTNINTNVSTLKSHNKSRDRNEDCTMVVMRIANPLLRILSMVLPYQISFVFYWFLTNLLLIY